MKAYRVSGDRDPRILNLSAKIWIYFGHVCRTCVY